MEAFLKLENNGIPLELASPVLKENQYDFADLAAFAKEHHVYLVTNANIFAKCNHDNKNLEHALSPDEFKKFLEKHHLLLNRTYRERIYLPEERICDVGTIRLCLNSEGNYYPCDGCHGLTLGNVKEHSNYRIIALTSHTSKLMLKILQARLQQYLNRELPDLQAGFRKGRETRD